MKILLGMLALMAGYCIGSFALIAPLCCLRCGIPLAKVLQKETGVDMSPMVKQYYSSLLFYFVVDVILAAAIILFVPAYFTKCIGIGTLIVLVMGFGETGIVKNNLDDFLEMAQRKLPQEDLTKVLNYLKR